MKNVEIVQLVGGGGKMEAELSELSSTTEIAERIGALYGELVEIQDRIGVILSAKKHIVEQGSEGVLNIVKGVEDALNLCSEAQSRIDNIKFHFIKPNLAFLKALRNRQRANNIHSVGKAAKAFLECHDGILLALQSSELLEAVKKIAKGCAILKKFPNLKRLRSIKKIISRVSMSVHGIQIRVISEIFRFERNSKEYDLEQILQCISILQNEVHDTPAAFDIESEFYQLCHENIDNLLRKIMISHIKEQSEHTIFDEDYFSTNKLISLIEMENIVPCFTLLVQKVILWICNYQDFCIGLKALRISSLKQISKTLARVASSNKKLIWQKYEEFFLLILERMNQITVDVDEFCLALSLGKKLALMEKNFSIEISEIASSEAPKFSDPIMSKSSFDSKLLLRLHQISRDWLHEHIKTNFRELESAFRGENWIFVREFTPNRQSESKEIHKLLIESLNDFETTNNSPGTNENRNYSPSLHEFIHRHLDLEPIKDDQSSISILQNFKFIPVLSLVSKQVQGYLQMFRFLNDFQDETLDALMDLYANFLGVVFFCFGFHLEIFSESSNFSAIAKARYPEIFVFVNSICKARMRISTYHRDNLLNLKIREELESEEKLYGLMYRLSAVEALRSCTQIYVYVYPLVVEILNRANRARFYKFIRHIKFASEEYVAFIFRNLGNELLASKDSFGPKSTSIKFFKSLTLSKDAAPPFCLDKFLKGLDEMICSKFGTKKITQNSIGLFWTYILDVSITFLLNSCCHVESRSPRSKDLLWDELNCVAMLIKASEHFNSDIKSRLMYYISVLDFSKKEDFLDWMSLHPNFGNHIYQYIFEMTRIQGNMSNSESTEFLKEISARAETNELHRKARCRFIASQLGSLNLSFNTNFS